MFSVVIPAYNEEATIAQCLESLTKQNINEPFEVIVVDNASTDRTGDIARAFQHRINIKVVRENRKGRGAARAAGCKLAQGEIILSTDADTTVPPEWIASLVSSLKKRQAVAVSGTVRIKDCGRISNAIFNVIQPIAMHLYRIFFGHYWLTGSNCAMWRNVYESSGGFDASLTSSEDTELSLRIKKLGRIQYVSTATISSGRRFRSNLILGLIAYPKTWIEKFVLKKKDVDLEDIR